ncbi:MAG: phospho-N-acetylmuramoyl-pentapeptide-transferase, partial [Spirochaetota bacterium]
LYLLRVFFGSSTTVYVPWIEQTRIEMGSWYHLAAVFFTVALVNSTNLSDGLDGLAAGLGIIAFITVMAVALALFAFAAESLRAAFLFDGRAEFLVGIAAMIGSLLGFLRYNVKPAQIFMGDTGSMAIGGTLACIGLATHNEVIILLISGVFFIETLSVVLQVGFFKLHKKRIFRMAPIHHHFEQIGWKEEKIVLRFWIVSSVFAAAALLAAAA